MKIIVVGAGLACAKVLVERDAEVDVFEASDGVGGRGGEKNGFLLDRGFQVYFTSYPVATATPGLTLAGEYTEDSSINGSMLSGEKAAGEVLEA